MTLLMGLHCEHEGADALLLCADTAVTYGLRELRTRKIARIGGLPLFLGGAGSEAQIQKFIHRARKVLLEALSSGPFSVEALEDALYGGILDEPFKGLDAAAFLLAAADAGKTVLFHLHSGEKGTMVLERSDFATEGSGETSGALLFLRSLTERNRLPSLDEGARMLAFVNLMIGRTSCGVSEMADLVAFSKGRIGGLAQESAVQLFRDASELHGRWLDLNRALLDPDLGGRFINWVLNENYLQHYAEEAPGQAAGEALVVDDMHPRQQKAFEALFGVLRRCGFEPKPFTDAGEAKAHAEAHPDAVRIVLLDRRVNGKKTVALDLLASLKAALPKVPVVMMARSPTREEMGEFLSLGAAFFVAKEDLQGEGLAELERSLRGLLRTGGCEWKWEGA
jgi:CheY-like chemotaxis protein